MSKRRARDSNSDTLHSPPSIRFTHVQVKGDFGPQSCGSIRLIRFRSSRFVRNMLDT
jgi:hypothetical protein